MPAATVEVFAALADENRQALLTALVRQGTPASATVLAAPMPVTRQAVERHLKVLLAAGLVSSEKVGREVRFSVRRAELDRSARWLTELGDRWDRSLQSVKARAEAAERRTR